MERVKDSALPVATAVSLVAAVAQIQSLAQEFPIAVNAAKYIYVCVCVCVCVCVAGL